MCTEWHKQCYTLNEIENTHRIETYDKFNYAAAVAAAVVEKKTTT